MVGHDVILSKFRIQFYASSGIKIKNCSFRHCAGQAVVLSKKLWGLCTLLTVYIYT